MSLPNVTDTRNFSSRDLAYTAEAVLPGIKDNIHVHSPLAGIFLSRNLNEMFGGTRLSGSGRRSQTGGERIRVNHRMGKSSNSKRLSGAFGTVNTAPQNNVRPSFANWRHYSGAITVSETDRLINTGDEALANLIADNTENEVLSLVDMIVGDLVASGGSDAINSLVEAISAADTYNGLNGATTGLESWNARGLSARGTAAASVSFAATGGFSSNGLGDMRTAWLNATEGTEQPTAIVTGQTNFGYYEGVLQPQERYTNATMADGGFTNLAFKTAPVMADSKVEDGASGTMLFLNTSKTYCVFLSGAEFDIGAAVEAQNQEATAAKVMAKLNLVTEDRRLNNKITGITA